MMLELGYSFANKGKIHCMDEKRFWCGRTRVRDWAQVCESVSESFASCTGKNDQDGSKS